MVTPDYYDKFRCIGGECKSNCCRGGWEIDVDDAALARFRKIKGEFGERVRAAVGDDGCFKSVGGHCPLLSDDGWCEMARHGERLCVICDEYPRFTEYWEDYCERGVSVSCEAAAALILGNPDRVTLAGSSEMCAEPIFTLIYRARGRVFEILQNRDADIFTRISLALDFTAQLQEQINTDDYETEPNYAPEDLRETHTGMGGFIGLLKGLEILNPHWREMLDKTAAAERRAPVHNVDPIAAEQLAVYFVFRYFLKGAFDCDPLTKMKFAAASVMTIIAMANALGDLAECARLYSIEIEHDEENMDAICDEFIFNTFSYEDILDTIG